MKVRKELLLVQFGIGVSAFAAAVLATAMTYPEPFAALSSLFGRRGGEILFNGLLVSSFLLGLAGLLQAPWTIGATGRLRWLAVGATVLAALGLGIGFYFFRLVASA